MSVIQQKMRELTDTLEDYVGACEGTNTCNIRDVKTIKDSLTRFSGYIGTVEEELNRIIKKKENDSMRVGPIMTVGGKSRRRRTRTKSKRRHSRHH